MDKQSNSGLSQKDEIQGKNSSGTNFNGLLSPACRAKPKDEFCKKERASEGEAEINKA